ncbi:MAG TPA: hypothetical protein VL527_19225 [Dongiaceae bacterium]|jgi:hypothetical protein|nr:hypothetical protein [Dongiaceae bacterium]
MSTEASSISPAPLFEVLPGLPGVGPVPEAFSATGRGTHSEGLVVCFLPQTINSWVGNFQPGICQYNAVFMHPDGRTVIVISGGTAYVVEPQSRTCLRHFGACITSAACDLSRKLLVISDLTHLWLFDDRGERWVSKRISLDGIRNLRIETETVSGESYDPMSDRWYSFSVTLKSGELQHRIRRFFQF